METIEFSDATQLTREQRSKVVQAMANGMIELFYKAMHPNAREQNIAMHGLVADASLVAIKKMSDDREDEECSELYTSLHTMVTASSQSREALLLAIGLAFMAGANYGEVEEISNNNK